MGIDSVTSNPAAADPQRWGGTAPKQKKPKKVDMQGDKMRKLHGMLMQWYLQERDKQAQNRYQMAIDEDFYDGIQWSDEDAQELMDRGQAPLVFNQVKPTINWMLGTERRTRVDGKALPREENDEQSAEVKTKLLKYLSDVNRTPFGRSQTWADCIIAGIGWQEDFINPDPTQELLSTRYESWKNIYHDSCAVEMDLSDARYIFRWRWLDLDVAIALCPEKEELLRSMAVDQSSVGMDEDDVYYMGQRVNTQSSGDYAGNSRRNAGSMYGMVNNGRERVKMIEAWYRMPVTRKMIRGGKFHGEMYDPENKEMCEALDDGYISVASSTQMEMRCALMSETHLLYESASPYKHNRFPFTPMWCYRRKRDNMPYGVIRDIRDAQEDYNKRASKALFILSTVRVIMEEGAVEDVEELRSEIARPNAIITVGKNKRFEIDNDKSLADEHIKLMMFDGQMIRDVGGVTDQNLGKDDKGLSGQAIGKLQDQGSIVTAPLFDNMRFAIQLQSEIQLSLIEQYYSAEKVIRIIGDKKPTEWLPINRYDPSTGRFVNDITASKADYIVAEQDFKASIRQAMFESMMELISKLPPDVGLAMLDMVVDFADVPNKEELVKRIRAINGQGDPSRKPTPEEQKQMEDAQKKKDELEQIQTDTMRAQMEKVQAESQKIMSDIQKSAADTQRIVADAVQKGVTAAYEALQAAQIVSTVPGVTPVADAILAGAGYQDQNGQDPNIPQPTGELPAMTPQPQHGVFVGHGAGAQSSGEVPSDGQPPPAPSPGQDLQQADGAQAGIETPANDGTQGGM